MQGFLIANFWDDTVLDQAKRKLPSARLDFRRAFHLQQILTLLKWTLLYGAPVGGLEPDVDRSARYELGKCLLKTSDLLMSTKMQDNIAKQRRSHSPKKYLNLQLHLGSGLEINNAPPVVNGVVRSHVIFEKILRKTPAAFELSRQFEEKTGITLDAYVDLTLGTLSYYLARNQKELVDGPGVAVIDPDTFFGDLVPYRQTQGFWNMESDTLEAHANVLSAKSELSFQQDFTVFRMKPFLRLDTGKVICVNPGFIQEKLEIGLFWAIVNSLQGETRKKAFGAWGDLFQTYVNQTFDTAVDHAKESYFPCPAFSGKTTRHEAFDGILISGNMCAVFECKGGFLPNKAKYAEDSEQFLISLQQKFGTDPGAGVEQLARKIGQLFGASVKEQRKLENIDLSNTTIVIPVLVVQDGFVSSLFTVPWLAKSFRDLMRKENLRRTVIWTSLLVLHVEDVEKLRSYNQAVKLSLAECLLFASKMGDPGPEQRIFAFADTLRDLLMKKGMDKVPRDELDLQFTEIINRLSLRLFNRKFERLT